MRFIRGHAVRGRRLPTRNGGLIRPDGGRWRIKCRDGSTVYFYRAVMEAHLHRHLRSDEQIHHRNGDCSDDRLENLELVSDLEHRQRHRPSHCKRGHPLSGDNLYVNPQGHHHCRICKRERQRRYRRA